MLQIALIQTNSAATIAANLEVLAPLIAQAAEGGATFITTPENVALMTFGRDAYLAEIAPEDRHPAVAFFAQQARTHGVWLQAGSLAIPTEDGRIANRSMLFAPGGAVVARYDKIHMFDVDLPGGESYRESAAFRPGDQAVLVEAPFATLGLTICYDLRFAGLYRALAQAGAQILMVPAAFTRQTGEAHWHTLLRARAIETGSFVVAPAQTGTHVQDRQTFGHSLVVDPWGRVLADGGDGVGVVTAQLDLAEVAATRGRIPALRHDRAFALRRVAAAGAAAAAE